MKRFFTIISALSLSLILLISSGCTGLMPLSFNNSFNGSNEPGSSYRETLTYAVSFGEYENISRSSLIKKEDFDFSANGEYKVSFKTVTKNDMPDYAVATDIDLTAETGNIYHLSATLNLNTTYKVNGEGSGDYVETIKSDVYFLPAGLSFAPIYSKVVQKTQILSADTSLKTPVYNVSKMENEYSIFYNQSSYKIIYASEEDTIEQTYAYTFKTAIDNAELLFALRNLKVEKESSATLPVVSASYGEAKSLLITHVAQLENALSLSVNGDEVNEKVKVNKLRFNVNENKNTGISQYLTIQESASTTIPYKALLTEYAHALVCYGANSVTGALIYKLVSVEYSK